MDVDWSEKILQSYDLIYAAVMFGLELERVTLSTSL